MLVIIIMTFLIILLQSFLSKQKNKYLGLILPILCLISSFLSSIGVFCYLNMKTSSTIVIAESAKGAESFITSASTASLLTTSSPFLDALTLFAISNLPTFIFVVIYKNCRNKLALEAEHKRMTIIDPE